MDLYIDRDELSRGLAQVQGIVERRSTYPILSHVLLHARGGDGGGLRITATDTEIAYIGELAATVNKPGEVAIDAASLFQVARALPEPTVKLTETSGHRLEITSGRALFRLPGAAPEEFPPLPAFDGQGAAGLSEGDLRRVVEQTAFAVSTDDARYGLNGAHLEARQGGDGPVLRMVCTDGHRLSASEASYSGDVRITPRMLVPRKALQVLRRLLVAGDQRVELAFGEGAIRLVRDRETFWFRMLDGEFPDYQAVVPAGGAYVARLRRDDLGSTLKRVGILVADRARAVRFGFSDGRLEVQVHNVDKGEVKEELPVEFEGEPVQVGFNARYLQDILAVLEGDYVELRFAGALGACLVRDPERDDAFFVVMPMRLD